MEETQKIMDDPNQTRTVFRQSWTMKWFPNLAGIDYLDYENESVDLSWDGWEDGLNWCKDNFLEDQETISLMIMQGLPPSGMENVSLSMDTII